MKEAVNRYFMAVQDGDVLDIIIYGDLCSWEWDESDVSSYTLAKLIEGSKAGTIQVRINSYGGEVAEGLAVYNALKNHPAHVKTVCDGFACSAASVVFMAGNERIMNSASLLMIHNAWSYARGSAKELRKKADDLEKISTAAANAYRAVMSISEEELERLLDEETWILPKEALSYGFATALMEEEKEESARQQYSVRQQVFACMAGQTGKREEGLPEWEKPEEREETEIPEPEKKQQAGIKKLFGKFKNRESEGEKK